VQFTYRLPQAKNNINRINKFPHFSISAFPHVQQAVATAATEVVAATHATLRRQRVDDRQQIYFKLN